MLIRRVIVVCVAVVMCAAVLYGCTAEQEQSTGDDVSLDAVSEATEARYATREIRGYEGVRLDPAVGPRDNSIKGTQYVKLTQYSLKITGLVDEELELKYDEVLDFPSYERLITLYCVEGWDATILWKGVKITDLIDAAGVSDSAKTVIFKAVDGYTTSLPIAEIIQKDMLLAYMSNGIDIPPEMGFPFIVLAEDKLGYKWARWVNEIELSDDQDYKGYWESNGYSNEADVNR